MKIKVPKKVDFLSHSYEIKFDNKELASAACGGLTRHYYQQIILSDGEIEASSERDQIFLHEFIHVIERHTGMRLQDDDIERISEGIADLFFRQFKIDLDWSEVKKGGDYARN